MARLRTQLAATALTAFVGGAAFTGGGVMAYEHFIPKHTSAPIVVAGSAAKTTNYHTSSSASTTYTLGTVPQLVQHSMPSVVKIQTVIPISSQSSGNPFFQSPSVRQFFGLQQQSMTPSVEYGIGSGFIISSKGYILTNDHVINGAKNIEVSVNGYKKPFAGKVVGHDYALDLAIVKISAPKALPTLKLANPKNVQVGEPVVAIGNPYGLTGTVTTGVISAEGRPLTIGNRHYRNLLQTNAAINPGNSGGPLLNMKGHVVGINTAVSTSGQGIGFAIPMSTVESVLKQLLTTGHVAHPWLGVEVTSLNPYIAQYLGTKVNQGAVIMKVMPNSPAQKAGLKKGEVITKLNNTKVTGANSLVGITGAEKAGSQIHLTLVTPFGTKVLPVSLGTRPSSISSSTAG